MHPNIHTTAGRHADQLRRQRAKAFADTQQEIAREHLALAVAQRGLTIHRHFERDLGPERSLWIDCRLDTAHTDHQLIYALLDQLGWQSDRERLSRVTHRYDIVRLKHAITDATLVVIIKLPNGAVEQWEAA